MTRIVGGSWMETLLPDYRLYHTVVFLYVLMSILTSFVLTVLVSIYTHLEIKVSHSNFEQYSNNVALNLHTLDQFDS